MAFDLTAAGTTVVKKWAIVVGCFYFCALLGLVVMTLWHAPSIDARAAAGSKAVASPVETAARPLTGDFWPATSPLAKSEIR